jgi:putative transferase (TIGR04331 family)
LINNKKLRRYLVTTADERSWKANEKIIFLGDWCRTFNRRKVWRELDYVIAKPYGNSRSCINKDYIYSRNIEDTVIRILQKALNKHHDMNEDIRFWNIILGHWLRRFINVILNRYYTIKQCLDIYKPTGTTIFTQNNYSIAPIDSYSAVNYFSDDRWNHEIYSRMLQGITLNNFTIEKKEVESTQCFKNSAKISPLKYKTKINNILCNFIRSLNSYIKPFDYGFFINTYLPFTEQLKLQAAFGQIPCIYSTPPIEYNINYNTKLRCKLTQDYKSCSNNIILNIITNVVFDALPVCYLEGFHCLNEKVNNLHWPKKPKFIFTSNRFDTDEIFKLWTAKKVKNGTVYIAGQHGSKYGTHTADSIEEITADKFLTWGWSYDKKKQVPAYVFTNTGLQIKQNLQTGNLLLVQTSAPNQTRTWDEYPDYNKYIINQQIFVKNLDYKCVKNIKIRLSSAYENKWWSDEKRWERFDNKLSLDLGHTKIRKLISTSRLVVFSYDSTGFLECLSDNVACMAFWENELLHIRKCAQPAYKRLVVSGILHFSPDSIVKLINQKWDTIDKWWHSDKIQKARVEFCSLYAKNSKNPIIELKNTLKANV